MFTYGWCMLTCGGCMFPYGGRMFTYGGCMFTCGGTELVGGLGLSTARGVSSRGQPTQIVVQPGGCRLGYPRAGNENYF